MKFVTLPPEQHPRIPDLKTIQLWDKKVPHVTAVWPDCLHVKQYSKWGSKHCRSRRKTVQECMVCPIFSQYEQTPGPFQTHWVDEWPCRRHREQGAVTSADLVQGGVYKWEYKAGKVRDRVNSQRQWGYYECLIPHVQSYNKREGNHRCRSFLEWWRFVVQVLVLG